MKLYFVYDPGGSGYTEFESKHKAQQFADESIKAYLNGEWDEDSVEQIVMGEVYSKAKRCNSLHDCSYEMAYV